MRPDILRTVTNKTGERGAVSPSVLNVRLAELREAELVDVGEPAGYRLTDEGKALLAALLPLHAWAEKWARRLDRKPTK